MRERRIFVSVGVVVILLVLVVGMTRAQSPEPQSPTAPQAAAGSAFTYQGHLDDGGTPANGTYDFRFILYDALSGGSQVGSTVYKANVSVTDGIFSLALGFGEIFDGTGLWLEAAVRAGNSTGSYTTLSPRQEITPAPYALHALNVPPMESLIKAAVYAKCGDFLIGRIIRQFNTIGEAVSVTRVPGYPFMDFVPGTCDIDFGSDLSARFWVAVPLGTDGGPVTCRLLDNNHELQCRRVDDAGILTDGEIMVTVY